MRVEVRTAKIGIVGDFEASRLAHRATNDSIRHAADALSVGVEIEWLPTPSLLGGDGRDALARCDGLWASPGSPYRSMEGALRGIQIARERNWPFVGT